MKNKGFTLVEAIIILTFLCVGAFVFFNTQAEENATQRDSQRKTAINAMYYSLEEYYYEKYGFYPVEITSKSLKTVEPELFTDTYENTIDSGLSEYIYDPIDCDKEDRCKKYTLSVDLENEDTFVRESRN